MLLLFLSELWLFMTVQTQTELLVDTSTGEQMQINVRALPVLYSPPHLLPASHSRPHLPPNWG